MARFKKVNKFFDKIKKSATSELKKSAKKSYNWFKDNVGKKLGATVRDLDNRKTWVIDKLPGIDKKTKDAISINKIVVPGHLYFYLYDPKWKQTLIYYDTFPLVMPLHYYNNGFLGMNFHYLPPIMRAKIFDTLLSFKQKTQLYGKETEYMKLSYDLLKGLSKTEWKPTIHRYLYSHVQSKFARIDSEEWENVLMLPTENFKKANKRQVWADSKDSVK